MKMLTNSLQVAQKANRRCLSGRKHPASEIDKRGSGSRALQGNPCRHRESNTRRSRQDPGRLGWGDEFYDEATDEKLDKKKVAEARREDMELFEDMGVYKKVPYAPAIERTGRQPIGTRKVNVKKADGRHRMRQVAKEFHNGVDAAMYVSTHPLDTLKL